MISKISSGAIRGVNGYIVTVEVDISQGLPAFDIVGLPDSAVKESRDRVRIAIKNSNIPFPIKRITINLAPADTRKEGPSFDLPIAVGILTSIGLIPPEKTENTLILGELSLDGMVRPVRGVLPIVHNALKNNLTTCIVPYENQEEAALISGIDVFGVKSLSEVIDHFTKSPLPAVRVDVQKFFQKSEQTTFLDYADVKGQEVVKRALEISAAGAHNILMIGPPGSGKTMMAKRLPGILPDLSFEESIEITKIYSVSGLLRDNRSLIATRPFRSPHHTISQAGLVGGGRIPMPGEVSLSHNGVLFLDELTEFQRNVLEALRQPIEDRQVTITRVNATLTYPSRFMLVASMNPCPCGHLGNGNKCTCTTNEISHYQNKLSAPLLDRVDLQVEAAAVPYDELHVNKPSTSSDVIKQRVVQAHQIQLERFAHENIRFNSELGAAQIEKYCSLGNNEIELLKRAFDNLGLSARAYHKVLKVARTIADLNGSETIAVKHLAEAIQYRSLDKKYHI